MSVKYSFLLLLLFIGAIGSSQEKVIDSLEQQLINPTNGKTKAENLNKLSYYYSRSNPEKGLKKAHEAMLLAQKNGDSFQLGIAKEYKGLNHKMMGNDSTAFRFYDDAEHIYNALDSIRPLAILSLNKGIFYSQRGRHNEAIENLHRAVESFARNKDTLLTGYSLGRIGFSQTQIGNYTSAMGAFLKGARLLEQSDNDETMYYGSIQGDLGVLHQKLEKYDAALDYHDKCVTIFKKHDYLRGVAGQLNDMATIYSKQEKYKKALETYKASYQIKKKINNKADIAIALGNIGIAYSRLDEFEKAIKYLDSAMILTEELNDDLGLSSAHENLGDIYLLKNNIGRAEEHFKKGIFYAEKGNSKRHLYLGKLGLSKVAALQENYKLAYGSLNEAMSINDSLMSDEKKEEIATLKAKYEYDKEKAILETNFEKDKALDQAEIQQQILIRNTAIGGGILGILALSIGFILVRRKKEAEFNEKLATSKLQTITAQLNPHFIFNTLNSINDYIQKNDKESASGFLSRFSKMIRKVLDHSKETEVPLGDEIAFLENYIKLEQQRLENNFNYKVNIDKSIDIEDTFIPPALLQPFIENSIWHGLSQKENGEGQLNFTITKNGETLTCIIDDNGSGLKESGSTHQSFGASSVQNRLDLLNQITGNSKAKVQFKQKEQGVMVEVQIPYSIDTDS